MKLVIIYFLLQLPIISGKSFVSNLGKGYYWPFFRKPYLMTGLKLIYFWLMKSADFDEIHSHLSDLNTILVVSLQLLPWTQLGFCNHYNF